MGENTIFVRKYEPDDERLVVNEREIWRYSGYFGMTDEVDEELQRLLMQVRRQLSKELSYKVCYRRMPIEQLPFLEHSENLQKCLKGSTEVILFAATIGMELDRHILRAQRLAPTQALLMQAYGAERVECLCDVFCREISELATKEGLSCTARFSPGYGDLSLETQKEVFALLDCNRQIGISLNESLLMTPSKSVTAVFGLGACLGEKSDSKCIACGRDNCEYRRQS